MKKIQFSQKKELQSELFSQYMVSKIQNLRFTSTEDDKKLQALLEGCILRNKLDLYKGDKFYYNDLQKLLEEFGASNYQYSLNLFKANHLQTTQDGKFILAQCSACGKYAYEFKYCPKCQHIRYCTQACEMKLKITHEREQCHPKSYPKVHHGIQVQIHFGTDLGNTIQVHYQHQSRITAVVRGDSIIQNLKQALKNSKSQILRLYVIQIVNKHLEIRRQKDDEYLRDMGGKFDTMEDIKKIYKKKAIIREVQLILYQQGGIMKQQVEQFHNNHWHMVYIFLNP